jgi:hypothetical protein
VLPSSIFYQDANGQWFRASDGVIVTDINKGKLKRIQYTQQSQGHIVYEAPLVTVPVLEMPAQQQSVQTYSQECQGLIIEGDEVLCRLTTLSSATLLKLEKK